MFNGGVYSERRSGAVPGAVVWSKRVERDAAEPARILPDGCMDLIWTGGGLLVAGPDSAAHLVPGRPGDGYVGLRFAPGTGPLVLGVPARELLDQRVPLEQLWPQRQVRESAERIWHAADRAAALQAVAVTLGRAPARRAPVPEAVLRGVRQRLAVTGIARGLALSERQLRRHCLDAFGYGPKTLERVLRLGRALDQARAGLPFARVAAVAGYADQAHLAREVRALTGLPLGQLLAEEGRR
ncbi:helix-turn-helix domain-containing protein [Kitasatospora sp. RB6PN24]|uniref:helix-turn-helix domain-containing protein n=1 Tax=Kitasatospora humi TaxID=2893891 RepID=UPI001E433248|nr:helix-turn-helix domain-containing protein [Kitasatospora humi]MCC9312258.1 helix-turn-helix domain-containing protein [Kitasatospora humi]